jgi:hypothetical protein
MATAKDFKVLATALKAQKVISNTDESIAALRNKFASTSRYYEGEIEKRQKSITAIMSYLLQKKEEGKEIITDSGKNIIDTLETQITYYKTQRNQSLTSFTIKDKEYTDKQSVREQKLKVILSKLTAAGLLVYQQKLEEVEGPLEGCEEPYPEVQNEIINVLN